MKIYFAPIGLVRNAITNRHEMPAKGVAAEIHISKKYQPALYRIERETHLWVLSYCHHAKCDVLRIKPKKSKCLDRSMRGVFISRSPDRPNPIALTKVKLIARKGLVLFVTGMDLIDGTFVLDIKSV